MACALRGAGQVRSSSSGGGVGRRSGARPLRANAVPAGARGGLARGPHPPHRDPQQRPSMGVRASSGPWARAGLLLLVLLLLLLLLGLLAPGAQGARGRGGAEKNSYRRTTNTFSQSVSSLFGEDNVRAAQKVGAGPAPAVTLPGHYRAPGVRGDGGPGAGGLAWDVRGLGWPGGPRTRGRGGLGWMGVWGGSPTTACGPGSGAGPRGARVSLDLVPGADTRAPAHSSTRLNGVPL